MYSYGDATPRSPQPTVPFEQGAQNVKVTIGDGFWVLRSERHRYQSVSRRIAPARRIRASLNGNDAYPHRRVARAASGCCALSMHGAVSPYLVLADRNTTAPHRNPPRSATHSDQFSNLTKTPGVTSGDASCSANRRSLLTPNRSPCILLLRYATRLAH